MLGDRVSLYSRGHGSAYLCQFKVKAAWLQGFALTPRPSPTGRGGQEI
ncbi:hypothetical protein FDUTEX481_05082 [Tolypothrix sp. PCC 7601]|nr:hypothetical protein FDUTEX481_05082 [Tolypothrix sp. PCC 7601]